MPPWHDAFAASNDALLTQSFDAYRQSSLDNTDHEAATLGGRWLDLRTCSIRQATTIILVYSPDAWQLHVASDFPWSAICIDLANTGNMSLLTCNWLRNTIACQ